MSYEVPEACCPKCGRHNDRATVLEGEPVKPSSGDISICFGCSAVSMFTPELRLRELTLVELTELKETTSWPEVVRVREAIELAHTHESR